MRNLKKTLCLVLALAFILGLCTVGAAGVDFDDENEILYTDAVKIMSGLGVLQGDDRDNDGKLEFRPKDGLTRAEAAKIIAFVVAGPSIENWPSRQVFDDVPAEHWAAKYIAYCYHNGIINGVGDNKFDPNAKVTLTAVAKMLLAACGYGKKDEFVGPDWEYNVAATAMKTSILQGLMGALEGTASREETALLAYNTLLKVKLVVLSSNTNSYVAESVNGMSNVTLADTVWELHTDEGVIIANKTNDSAAKGTILDGTGMRSYYVTEEDENPAILGHQVSITYRLETVGSKTVATAYFMVDECTEVKGAQAAKAGEADKVYNFESGKLMSNVLPVQSLRASVPGTFVLNKDGLLVAYKNESYFASILTVSSLTGAATVVDPSTGTAVQVEAPAGARNGDVVTVYHMGDIYKAEPVSTIRMKITAETYDRAAGVYTYNDGVIIPSSAENLSYTSLPFTKLTNYSRLEVGGTYTLYLDSEGGCLGFTELSGGSGGTVAYSGDYVMLVTTYTRTDDYGTPGYYAQVIKGSGSWTNVQISKADFDAAIPNNVYRLGTSGALYTLTAPTADEVSYEKYSTSDPTTMFDQATFIWYNGSRGDLVVDTTQKPKAGTYVYYAFAYERESTVNVRRIKAVWFQYANTDPVPVNNSYIYVATTLPVGTRLVDGVARGSYEGYLNGTEMTELVTDAAPSKVGFATYSRSSAGVYTLSFVKDGNGLDTGVRTVSLIDGVKDVFFLNNKLYVKDSNGELQEMSMSGVKIIVVGTAKESGINLSTQDAINRAANAGKVITMTFVEVVSGKTHSIGGTMLVVTAVD